MERKEILEKIKTTEKEIQANIDAAQHKRNEILAQAQKQAQKLQDEAEKTMKGKRETQLIAAKKEIGDKRQKTIKKAMTEAETIKKKAHVEKAKEFFIQEFMEFIHV
jgi:vacuolar-type H+-ATPase subunit H